MIYEGDSEMQLRNSLMGLEVVECPGCHSSVAKVEGMVCLCGRYGWEKDGWFCESDFGKFIVIDYVRMRP